MNEVDDFKERIQEYCLKRIGHLFNVDPKSLSNDLVFGEDLKSSFVSNFKLNEFDKIHNDILDVADALILNELNSGALEIRTVGDYCAYMVRCYLTNEDEVKHILKM